MWEHSFHAEQTRRPRCPTLESPVGVCAGARVARQKPVTRVSGACGDRSAHRQPQALKGSSDGRPVNGDRAPSPDPADGPFLRGGAPGRCTRRSTAAEFSVPRRGRTTTMARSTIRWWAGSVDDASPERRVAGAGRGGCRPGNGPEGRAPLVPCSDIMFIIGYPGSGLEPRPWTRCSAGSPWPDRSGTRLEEAPGMRTATTGPTASPWLCGRAHHERRHDHWLHRVALAVRTRP